ncbi:uncharacterized protein LOC135533894 [Oncorhynchus masou masou]|uniref:uncharacterized protein LOC135533894 n=1 Tax=Oncorhynchus masou masou TaxID=90313 RepID=UPI0031831194
MRGIVLLFLLSLWPGGNVDAINAEVLAKVVQEMRRFGLQGSQYAMAVLLTQDQCTNGANLRISEQPQNVQKALKVNAVYTGKWLIAATPLKKVQAGRLDKTDHAEYRLLSPGNNNLSPMKTLINIAVRNAGQCIVFFSTYSPCLEKCNKPYGQYNILPLIEDNFKHIKDNNLKAFVFSSVWDPSKNHTGVTKPTKQLVLDSFRRIETYLPLYRCDRFKENNKWVNRCYRCVNKPDDCLSGY